MPAVTSTTAEHQNDGEQRMWDALRKYIIRERQKKKEEYEAEVEEERLRKEREARERQDVMTLEETKEQIEQLEEKVKQLEKEKQQLFMQLKKVLNEDEVRKRQQQKESEMQQPMKMPMGNMQMPMYSMQGSGGQGEPPPSQGRPPPMSSHMLNKHTIVRGPIQAGVKRNRSPSPNTYQLYPQRLHQPHKHQAVYSDHKVEDGRMGRQLRGPVLWNKQPQYGQNQMGGSPVSSSAYYAMPSSAVGLGERAPLLFGHHAHSPHTPQSHAHAHAALYAPAQPPHIYIDMMNRDAGQHQDQKKDQPQVLIGLSEPHHPSVSIGPYTQPPPSARHMAISNNKQPPKPVITLGYPVQQSNPNVQNPNIYPNRHRY